MLGTSGAGAEDAVGTTGRWQVSPNAVNSVPREVVLEVDVRDIDGSRRDKTIASVVERARAICKKRGTTHTVETVNQDDPAICSPMVICSGVHTPPCSHAARSMCLYASICLFVPTTMHRQRIPTKQNYLIL